MSRLPKYKIQSPSPLHALFTGMLFLSLIVLSLYCWKQYKLLQLQATEFSLISETQSEQQRESQQQAVTIGSQQQQLSQSVASAQQKSQALVIQEATNEELEKQLTLLQDEAFELKKELSFYQTVSQQTKASGLKIHTFQLFSDITSKKNQFRYRLILTQGQKIEGPLEGKAILQLPVNENRPSPVILTEINFNLRYVQILEGYFTLSTDHTPQKIAVVLSQQDKPNRLQSFDWQLTTP